MQNFILIAFLTLLSLATAREYKIEVWADIRFSGDSTTYSHTSLGVCDTLSSAWSNRISSVNTHDNCYVLYDQAGCTGNRIYMHPGSKFHNNLVQLNFNDKTKSLKICELDDSIGDSEGFRRRRSLDQNRPERNFWVTLFGLYSSGYLNTFNSRASGRRFISWDFIPGVSGSPGQTYQLALEWVQDIVNAGTFRYYDMTRLRDIANRVVQDRADRNQQHESTSAGTQTMAIHVQIEFIWRRIVDILTSEIARAIDSEEDELGK